MCASRVNLMREAVKEAGSCLRSFGVSYTEPIDVFKIIHDAQIELIFRPLEDRPDGFYIPPIGKGKAGILLNSRRPLSRKRYTAAHELCHFIRQDATKIRVENTSEECALMTQGTPEDEIFADFFAAHFLMPPKLIKHCYRRLGLKTGSLAPRDLYRLSLCMCTSYKATCNQLANLEFIPRDNYAELINIEPARIKAEWVERPGRRDIWPIDQQMSGLKLMTQVDDIIRVELPETPSTGYVWSPTKHKDSVLRLESSSLRFSHSAEFVGQFGNRVMNFSVQESGRATIDVNLRRPWESAEVVAENFNLHVLAAEREFKGHYLSQLLPMAA